MVRWLNVIAVLALLGSAVYAYRTKYETIFYAEQIAKLRNQNQRERDSIAVLQAEWAHLTRPTRIQSLADQHLDLKQLTVDQIVQVTDLPDQPPRQDSIGKKLELLGLGEGTSPPRAARVPAAAATTPGNRTRQER
jgi:cell division protein FtsL